MIIEWDVPIEMDDGLQLRADIFRPIGPRQARHGPTPRKRQLRHGRRQGRLPEAIDAHRAPTERNVAHFVGGGHRGELGSCAVIMRMASTRGRGGVAAIVNADSRSRWMPAPQRTYLAAAICRLPPLGGTAAKARGKTKLDTAQADGTHRDRLAGISLGDGR